MLNKGLLVMQISKLLTITIVAALSLLPIARAEITSPTQKFNQRLHDLLPKEILDKGHIVSVVNGSFPPYTIVKDSKHFEGAAIDLDTAVSQLLGIKIIHRNVGGFSAILMGIKAGRYDYKPDAVGDFPKREKNFDIVDYVQEYVSFAVKKGNPLHINGLDSICGQRIAVLAGGSAERVIRAQSTKCRHAGQNAVHVQSYTDLATSILAVQSDRADAFFSSQAPLSYFVRVSNGALELAGTNQSNGFGNLYQGTVVAKGAPLGKVLLACYQELYANGTYDVILRKWGLTRNRLKQPGINLATAKK
jgi:polar amino acid transport system substrate-binding protein